MLKPYFAFLGLGCCVYIFDLHPEVILGFLEVSFDEQHGVLHVISGVFVGNALKVFVRPLEPARYSLE